MCLNETISKVHIGKQLSDNFPIPNGLKQGDVLSPLIFNFALEYTVRKVQENQVGLKLNATHQLLLYADGVYLLGYNIREGVSKEVTNGSKSAVMDVIGFLYVSLGSSTIQLHDSLGSRRACTCSDFGFSSQSGDRA
jgi:hypothetical protein